MYLSDLILVMGCMMVGIYVAVISVLIAGVVVRRVNLRDRA